jgi:hypothetical protein
MWWNDKVDNGVGLKDLSTHESWDVHMLTTRGWQALLVRWPWEGTPRWGGRQQPHQTLIKGRKYKGGGNATGWWHCPSPWCSCGAILF